MTDTTTWTKQQRVKRNAFAERLYRLLRTRPEPNSTAVGQLSQEDTALYDAIRLAADDLLRKHKA